ncbi:hypothetical protein AGR6A_Lc90472 [Agrobacterium sp. NCPPB 925]|nr:hypothetical protein AGR6A_Lc90472 [Agrobacterium sp. NCPPB 925]
MLPITFICLRADVKADAPVFVTYRVGSEQARRVKARLPAAIWIRNFYAPQWRALERELS